MTERTDEERARWQVYINGQVVSAEIENLGINILSNIDGDALRERTELFDITDKYYSPPLVASEPEPIVIENNKVKYNGISIPFSEFAAQILGERLELLPKNCIYRDKHHFIIEVPPGIFRLRTNSQNASLGYKLAFSWQYFVFNVASRWDREVITDVYLFWSKTKIKNIRKSRVIPALIPNINSEGRVCLGDTVPDSTFSLRDRIEDIVSQFYSPNSKFTDDYGWKMPSIYLRNSFRPSINYRRWQSDSKNPLCFTEWSEWEEYTFPLTDVIALEQSGNIYNIQELFR
jgi:hypothetical protein